MVQFNKYSTKAPETLQALRTAQADHNFIIPSDYVHFLMNCNGFEFEEPPIFELEGDEYEFGEFYDLETVVWELNHYRGLVENYGHSFWLNNFISVGTIDDHRIIIGVTPNNINEVYFYNDEEGNTVKASDSIFRLIENYI